MQTWAKSHTHSLTLSVFVISFVVLFLLMDRQLNIFDEGLILVNAMRILNGDVIHRDFYSPYGPGAYYLLATLFNMDSHWYLLARIYGIATMAGIVAVTFGLLVERISLSITFVFTAICGAWMVASPYYLYPLFPSSLLALIGSALLLRWFEQRRFWQVLLAGVTAGITALFRYDAGFFLSVAHLVAVIGNILFLSRRFSKHVISQFCPVVTYVTGAAGAFLPFAIYFLTVAPISSFISDVIDYPLHYYPSMRSLPFPGPDALISDPASFAVYLPILTVLFSASAVVITVLKSSGKTTDLDTRDLTFITLFTVISAFLYYKGIVRVSNLHMLMSIIPALLVVAMLVDRGWGRNFVRRGMALFILIATLFPTALAVRPVMRSVWNDSQSPLMQFIVRTGLAEPKVVNEQNCTATPATTFARQATDYCMVSQYIRRFSDPNETIFVGLNRHDRIFINPVALYFTAERLPGTHWHQFEPGLQTREDIQSEIISDLKENSVRWIIRDGSFEYISEDNASSKSSGTFLLDHYLEDNYRQVASSGSVQIWLINGVAAPDHPGALMPAVKPH